jgi:two-component system, NarL family, invasion response regulator UvrY
VHKKGAQVMLVDDHELLREGLKRILLDSRLVKAVGEARNGGEALELCRREKWDGVLLDLNLPGRGGLEVLKEIKREWPSTPVLVLSIYPEEQFAVRVMRAGADGYLTKGAPAREVQHAVKTILQGQKFISPTVAERLVEALSSPAAANPHLSLSDREFEVVRKISVGKTVGEIARELHLSVKTVSTYRTTALRKLGLKNNAQIMSYAREHGLVN